MRNNFVFYPYFENHMPLMLPPTLLSILNSYCNYGKKIRVPILDLSRESRTMVFDFSYPLSSYINKEEFEIMFLDHFLDRRIGQETFTAFKLHLRSKLREIMPDYNQLFDALGNKISMLSGDGYTKTYTEREDELTEQTGETNTKTESEGSADRRFSDTPQGQLVNVREGAYLTDYTYSEDKSIIGTEADSVANTDRGKDRTYTEIHDGRISYLDSIAKYKEEKLSLYEMIYHDCDELFYQLME